MRECIELGTANGRGLTGRGSSFGADVAVEVTPVENWLELEKKVCVPFPGVTAEKRRNARFKKPWTLSRKAEFMVGAGPEWIHTSEFRPVTNSPGAEVVLDFMFWPSRKDRFGWFLEPGYDHGFGRGHEQSVGISGGLLIAIP